MKHFGLVCFLVVFLEFGCVKWEYLHLLVVRMSNVTKHWWGMIKLWYFSTIFFSRKIKKQRREVSINRPASYEPAALPLRHPAFIYYRNKCLCNQNWETHKQMRGYLSKNMFKMAQWRKKYLIFYIFFILFVIVSLCLKCKVDNLWRIG